ncbi:hypothetical protein ACJX0J_034133, partial [Zea mays]
VKKVHTKKAAAPKIAKQESSDDDTSDETFESDEEPAKKPVAKPLAAVAKNGSKTVKQESSSDEDSSEDESDDDSDDGSDIVFNLLNRVYDDVGKRWSRFSSLGLRGLPGIKVNDSIMLFVLCLWLSMAFNTNYEIVFLIISGMMRTIWSPNRST